MRLAFAVGRPLPLSSEARRPVRFGYPSTPLRSLPGDNHQAAFEHGEYLFH